MEYTYYQILGVNKNASHEDIKSAYKKLAKKYHPDKHQQNEFYEEHFKKITEAYNTLSNSTRRNRYDLKLSYQQTNGSQHTSSNTNPSKPINPSRTTFKKKYNRAIRKSEYKMLMICLLGLLVLVIFSLLLSSFMNRYSAEQMYSEGYSLEQNKVYLGALEKYSEAIGFDKEFPEPYVKRGLLRIKFLGDVNGGLYDLSMAIKHSKNVDHLVYFARAKIFIQFKNYEAALADLQSSLRADPKFDSAYFYRAEIYNYFIHSNNKAITDYSKFLLKNKNSSESYFGRGYAYQNNKKYSQSIEDYNAAIQLAPEKGNYYYYRGFSKLYTSDSLGACVDWDQARSQGFAEAEEPLKNYCSGVLN